MSIRSGGRSTLVRFFFFENSTDSVLDGLTVMSHVLDQRCILLRSLLSKCAEVSGESTII